MSDNELLTRGVEETVPTKLAEEKLQSGKKLRIYMGIDPTGSKLHLGHSVPLRKLQQFCNAGHEVIFLIGDYTAMIGDPTGRDQMRQALTKEQVAENFQSYKEQAEKILDFSKVHIRYNSEWLGQLRGNEIMKIMSHFTVQQMLQRDMFRERMKRDEDLNPTEFLYPLLQAYDSVVLDVDYEIGGNDQLFNMLCGRKLQKAYEKREKCVMTMRLIEGIDGRKMSKTYDNCIYLTDTANDMYGKVLSIKDDLIATYMECCTDIPMAEIEQAVTSMKAGANPKDYKMHLARTLVQMYHGEEAAGRAEKEFNNVFAKGQLPDEMPEITLKKGSLLIDVLVGEGIVPSKAEVRRLVEQKGITLNDTVVQSIEQKAERGVVKVGKRKFLKLL